MSGFGDMFDSIEESRDQHVDETPEQEAPEAEQDDLQPEETPASAVDLTEEEETALPTFTEQLDLQRSTAGHAPEPRPTPQELIVAPVVNVEPPVAPQGDSGNGSTVVALVMGLWSLILTVGILAGWLWLSTRDPGTILHLPGVDITTTGLADLFA